MAHARRSPQQRVPSSSITSPSIKRRNNLRRSASRAQSHGDSHFISSSVLPTHRPVLVPLQPNLRRLPSRGHLQKDPSRLEELMRDTGHVMTGSKRKRVASTNENAHTNAKMLGGPGRGKRLRTNSNSHNYRRPVSSDESESDASEMEVDATSSTQEVDTDSDVAENEGEELEECEAYDSSDDFLLHRAAPTTLHRQLKQRLVELYELCGLTGNGEVMTKSDLVDAIVNNRDDVASVPPSSPPGKSDYSSDDGHVAGGEETDAGGHHSAPGNNPLRRRVTMHNVGQSPVRQPKGRSFSMGNLLGHGEPPKASHLIRKSSMHIEKITTGSSSTRRRVSTRASPASNGPTSGSVSSPPTTRLRSRNVSTSVPDASTASSYTNKNKGKGKAKQVEFSNDIEVHLQSPSKKCSKGKEVERQLIGSESDLTELEDSDDEPLGQPSPRRLRSKDRDQPSSKDDPQATPVASSKQRRKSAKAKQHDSAKSVEGTSGQQLRVPPLRKAKKGTGCLKEPEDENEDENEEYDELEENEEEEDHVCDVGEEEDAEEEVEVDELISSASLSPPPESRARQTPLKKRLRPRRPRKSTPTVDEENEGDDEDEEGADDNADDDDGAADEEQGDEEEEVHEDDEVTIAVEPRKLRNGKIVGEEDVEMDVDEESVTDEEGEAEEEGEEEEDEGDEDDEDEDTVDDARSVDLGVEGDSDEDENMEEEVDLTVATAKTLVRLRRDDLVRLCETREIDPAGTKPQLAEALLQWRDRQGNDFSSPSSAGTVRPSLTRKKRRTKHSSSINTTVPVLLRSENALTDEPRTPVPSKEKEKENEDLELDLESLGLEDREIPPEKLTKLEKIGSGGFKDVFIGKFKNRKIAISEFRGQLSAMDIKELKLLGAFNHPNIVRFLGVSIPENTKETPVMIISELCSNGDLFDYIRNTNAPTLHKVLSIMLDIARGLEYLHTRKPSIIHRDCKSSNILITAKGTAKIADFGLAKVKQSTRSMVRSLVGTVNWQAPELWHAHPKYNHKVDVFSCAMVFWEMLQWHATTKKFPWEGMNEHAIYEIVGAKRQRPSISGLRKQWCPELIDLVERMWAQEHQERPTISEVVESLEDLLKKY